MVLKTYISVAKGLKLKVRKVFGLISTFVEVTGEKLVGGFWPTILNRLKGFYKSHRDFPFLEQVSYESSGDHCFCNLQLGTVFLTFKFFRFLSISFFIKYLTKCSKAGTGCVLEKKLLSKILQYSQESTCVGVSFYIASIQTYNFIKNGLQHRCFSMNIARFLRPPILKNIYERLFLNVATPSL